MNANSKKNTAQSATPSAPSFYSKSQSSSATYSTILSTNSSTLIESYDPISFLGSSSPTLSSSKPQQQQHFSEPSNNLFYENFPRQNFIPQMLPHQTMYQQQHQQYFQTFNQFKNYQSVIMPTLFTDHFASTPTSYSPVMHISTSPIEPSYLNSEVNVSVSNSFEGKLDEITSKLSNLISDTNFSNSTNKSVVDSYRNTPDALYTSTSLSDWSDTPKTNKLWSPQNSNDISYENEANRSYLSSPRPIRAIKKGQNMNVINSNNDFVTEKKSESSKNEMPRFEEENVVSKGKTSRRNLERKNTFSSDSLPHMPSFSSSSQSRFQLPKKNLPLRSLGVDISAFLNKKDSDQERTLGISNQQGKMKLSNKTNNKKDAGCRFCIMNGESIEVYTCHSLKNELGKVECPMLRAHVCKQCGESGDFAHTIKYCPETIRREKYEKIKKYIGQA